ncbi:SAM-dependent methyltransferase [Streptomyces sp. NPDC087300]|uniref:SAM-dependent methyltransferase n=1 Tax=Streptomyces sp. NPDC087300 TaxID=3365780 RepID=UPI00382BF6B6
MALSRFLRRASSLCWTWASDASSPVCSRSRSASAGRAAFHLPYLTDSEAARLLATLRAWLPVGSVVSVTHTCTDHDPDGAARLTEIYAKAGIPFHPRPRAQVLELLDGWGLYFPKPLSAYAFEAYAYC